MEPDTDGRYGIGGFRWCWSRADRYRVYTLTIQLLAYDDPDRAATHTYPALTHLDQVAAVHLARLGCHNRDGLPAHIEVTCARDIPGNGICLRRPGHGDGCARTTDPSAPGQTGERS